MILKTLPPDLEEAFCDLLDAYRAYYDVRESSDVEPFLAEAEFRLHDEEYFLIKAAKVTEYDSSEQVFFAAADRLTAEDYRDLEKIAWEEGLDRAVIGEHHRSSDVVLLIVCGAIEPAAAAAIRKARQYKSYRLGLRGYSHLRTLAYVPAAGETVHNRMGANLQKVIDNIQTLKGRTNKVL